MHAVIGITKSGRVLPTTRSRFKDLPQDPDTASNEATGTVTVELTTPPLGLSDSKTPFLTPE